MSMSRQCALRREGGPISPARLSASSRDAGCRYELQVFKDAANCIRVAENHHLRLSAARNLKNRTWATFVILVSPMK
jgi:hypothetical protein